MPHRWAEGELGREGAFYPTQEIGGWGEGLPACCLMGGSSLPAVYWGSPFDL